jgi:hypothetical protein
MKIEIRKISFYERMSEETNCFVADLYINGKKVGICKNDGHGGCSEYHGDSKENDQIIREAEAYCKTLPKVKCGTMEWEQNLEDYIDQLLEDHLKAKAQKKVEKLMLTAILWGVPNSGCYTALKYAVPLTHVAKVQPIKLQETVNAIKFKYCCGNVQILNTNLKELGINV